MAFDNSINKLNLDASLDMPFLHWGGIWSVRTSIPHYVHHHSGFEITCIVSGETNWRVLDEPPVHLSGGDIFVTQPLTEHCGGYDVIEPCTYFWMIIDPAAPDANRYLCLSPEEMRDFHSLLNDVGNSVIHADHSMKQLLRSIREALEKCCDQVELIDRLWLRTLIAQWVVLIYKALLNRGNYSKSPEICVMLDYMSRNFDTEVTLSHLANRAGMSESWFAKRFKDEVGLSPIDYLNRLRCAKARDMLASTSESVTRIAMDVGFSNSQYFATAFKKYVGMAPSDYRKHTKDM